MTLAERFAAALGKRLYPCTPLSPKQAAFAIGVDKATVWRWKNDLASIPAQALVDLDAFFAARGYPGFAAEVLTVVPRETSQERGPWRVERLPLDQLSTQPSQDLASLAASDGDVVTAAFNMGGSIFFVDGENIISLHIGASAGMRTATRKQFTGCRLDQWPDQAYGALMKGHVLEARLGGATYYQMSVPVLDLRIDYRRAMFRARGGFVVSISERLAA